VRVPKKKTVQKLVKPVSTMIIGETKTYESRVVSGVVQPSDTTQLSFEVTGKVQEVYLSLAKALKKVSHSQSSIKSTMNWP
jgi:multidrug efflux pump subunit AcrA (membrane-fusion protein)